MFGNKDSALIGTYKEFRRVKVPYGDYAFTFLLIPLCHEVISPYRI